MRVIYFLQALVFVLSSCREKLSTSIMLKNPMSEERVDKSLRLSRMESRAIGDELLSVVKEADGTYIPCQVGDMDQDGLWGELASVYTLGDHEAVEPLLDWTSAVNYPVFERRTNIRYEKMTSPGQVEKLSSDMHGKRNLPRSVNCPYQMDGLVWKNDKVGFHHYSDSRNCRDLSGKRASEVTLDAVGLRTDGYPDDTYRTLREWGCGILGVMNSLRPGGVTIQLQDTLLQVGVEQRDTVDIIDSSYLEMMAEGPVRPIFRLDFTKWNVLGTKVDVHETVTTQTGKNGYEEEIRTSPLPESVVLVTGLVGSNNTKEFVEKRYAGKQVPMITHDEQTMNKDYKLDMTLLILKGQLVGMFHTPDKGNGILKTRCAKLRPGNNGYRHQAYVGWELGVDDFSKREEFIRLVDTYADYSNYPISIHIN